MYEAMLPEDKAVELAGFEAVEAEDYVHEKCGGNSNGSCTQEPSCLDPVTLTHITNDSLHLGFIHESQGLLRKNLSLLYM